MQVLAIRCLRQLLRGLRRNFDEITLNWNDIFCWKVEKHEVRRGKRTFCIILMHGIWRQQTSHKDFHKKKITSYYLCLTLSFGNPYWKYVQFKTAIIDNILQWNTWFLRFVCQSYLYRIRIECIMSYNRGWNYLDTIFYLDLLAVKKELICQCWPIFVVLSIVLDIFGNAMSLKKEEILWPTNPTFVLS